jgi:hypothetical protein
LKAPVDWLLEGEAYIQYRTRRDLLGQLESDPQVSASRLVMLADLKVQALLEELGSWPGTVIASHKSAGQPFHKLSFLAELGLHSGDPKMNTIINRILAHQSAEGPFQLPVNIPVHYGGTGQEQWAWALCDAPLVVFALVKFGLEHERPVRAAINHLTHLQRQNGWPCVVSKELGKFRGPGRKDDPCPYASLVMLKLLVQTEGSDSPAARSGADTLLTLWQESLAWHPYMFFMGTDFRKLKNPLVWYDLLHVLDVLTQFPWLRKDSRLLEMVSLLRNKADQEGRFKIESVWTAWKDWEFGQKNAPSRWLTLTAWRILQRMDASPLENG